LPRISRGAGGARRIQWQVHVQSVRAARRLLRYVAPAHSPNVSQFLSARETLAVHRDSARARPFMNHEPGRLAVLDLEPAKSDFLSETIAGLSRRPPTLPCKYFYDERGAALFQKICDLPEYYITRTEIDILDRNRAEIASHLGPNIELIGLGTGAGTKTRILIEALETPAVYIPVDISEKQLCESTANFRKIFPDLEILPVCADYLQPVVLPSPHHKPARNVVYFPGSTIGNFEPDEAVQFLRRVANVCREKGGLLIGADLKKARDVLEGAYNDRA